MYALRCISRVYESAEQIPFDDTSRIVLMSDCHRGDGSWADDFSKNQHIYFAALNHYYNENYTYIELGDGDELWENKSLQDIIRVHNDVFWLLSKFFHKGRLYFIFGNHDLVKKNRRFVRNNYYSYYDEREDTLIPLFTNIKVHEGLILRHAGSGGKIFLVHGHQADYFNYKLWWLSRFLVRYFWKPLELFGVNDPTSAAKNYGRKEAVARCLTEWAAQNKSMLIAGHTHKPVFPEVGETPYFNDGSCVHPHSITAIEIVGCRIMLVKWEVKTRQDGTLYVGREMLAGPRNLTDYFAAGI